MAQSVSLVRNQETKTSFVGWSWTIFFFQSWPMLFRGNVKAFFGWGLLLLVTLITVIIWVGISIFLALKWNNNQTAKLLAEGYTPVDEENKSILKTNGIL